MGRSVERHPALSGFRGAFSSQRTNSALQICCTCLSVCVNLNTCGLFDRTTATRPSPAPSLVEPVSCPRLRSCTGSRHHGEKESTSHGQVPLGQDVDAVHHLRQLRREGHDPPRAHPRRRALARQVCVVVVCMRLVRRKPAVERSCLFEFRPSVNKFICHADFFLLPLGEHLT